MLSGEKIVLKNQFTLGKHFSSYFEGWTLGATQNITAACDIAEIIPVLLWVETVENFIDERVAKLQDTISPINKLEANIRNKLPLNLFLSSLHFLY